MKTVQNRKTISKDWHKLSLGEKREIASVNLIPQTCDQLKKFENSLYFTLREVSDKLKVSKNFLYDQIYAGHLKTVKIGRCHRVEELELNAWLTSQRRG